MFYITIYLEIIYGKDIMNKTFYISLPLLPKCFTAIKKVLLENPAVPYVLILQDEKQFRSTSISTHFHGHVTWIWKKLNGYGINIDRLEVYFEVLLLACKMPKTEGAYEYPYTIIDNVFYPKPTRECTNKELMQAIEACHRFAASEVQDKYGLIEGIILPEKEEWK